MKQLNITAKIWMSIGVFVLGYVLSTMLGQFQGRRTETRLRETFAALSPGSPANGKTAETAFQPDGGRLQRRGDHAGKAAWNRAGEDGQKTVETLKSVAAVPGLSSERAAEAQKLSSATEQLLIEARATYGSVLINRPV